MWLDVLRRDSCVWLSGSTLRLGGSGVQGRNLRLDLRGIFDCTSSFQHILEGSDEKDAYPGAQKHVKQLRKILKRGQKVMFYIFWVHICIYICVYVHTYMYIYTYTCVYVYVH